MRARAGRPRRTNLRARRATGLRRRGRPRRAPARSAAPPARTRPVRPRRLRRAARTPRPGCGRRRGGHGSNGRRSSRAGDRWARVARRPPRRRDGVAAGASVGAIGRGCPRRARGRRGSHRPRPRSPRPRPPRRARPSRHRDRCGWSPRAWSGRSGDRARWRPRACAGCPRRGDPPVVRWSRERRRAAPNPASR